MGQTEFVHSTAPGSPCRSASEAARFDPRVVGSAREGSDGDEGLGSLEEEGELPARSPGRGPLRSLQVHVSTTGARRLSLGPRVDPRLGHLRQVHAPPLTGLDRLRSRIAVADSSEWRLRGLPDDLSFAGSSSSAARARTGLWWGPRFESGGRLLAICQGFFALHSSLSEGVRGPPEVYFIEGLKEKQAVLQAFSSSKELERGRRRLSSPVTPSALQSTLTPSAVMKESRSRV